MYVGLVVVVSAYTVWKLKNIADGWEIKRELKYVAIWAFVGLIVVNIVRPKSHLHVTGALFWVMINGMLFQTLTFPVICSYRMEKRKHEALLNAQERHGKRYSCSVSQSLAECMKNPEEFEMFTEQLIKEFSVGNMLFYREVEKFDQKCVLDEWESMTTKTYMAGTLYADFIADDNDSDLQVHAHHRHALQKHWIG